ncbi:MRN complex-interacting protein isoform X2 [Rhagoletis pomonella]|uniref:MRN complex-interacting protein isoform X2 n=1 Tax=Rhagoletis pomonella TaxID=28610 RepID=UPI00177EBCF4|nr:MRN complex-interacting protein isoform X2 [Rhagoletis pomonella]
MPQEIRVVQCFECKIYQVDLVKKAKKWTCKVCNAKQSLQHELFRGSGPECRARVQELNKQREMNALNNDKFALEVMENLDVAMSLEQQPKSSKLESNTLVSKWSNFVDERSEKSATLISSDKHKQEMDNLFCFQNTQKWAASKSDPSTRNTMRSSLENCVNESKWDAYI